MHLCCAQNLHKEHKGSGNTYLKQKKDHPPKLIKRRSTHDISQKSHHLVFPNCISQNQDLVVTNQHRSQLKQFSKLWTAKLQHHS